MRRTRAGARWTSIAAALLALVLLLASLRLFEGPAASAAAAWKLYLGGLAMLLVAAWPWHGRPAPTAPRVSRREWVALALVLALGAAFRLHRLTTLPYGVWFDEAQNVLETQRILDDPRHRPVFVAGLSQMPALSFYVYAPFVKLLGPGVLAVRLAATLFGMAALLAVWGLGRELFGPREGLLAAGLLAVSRWHVGFSRFGMGHIFAALVPALVLLLFARCLRRGSPRGAVLCGVVLGLGLQLYYSLCTLPAVLVLMFLWGRARGFHRGATPLLALSLTATALAAAPLVQYALHHRSEYAQRFREASIVKAGSAGELAEILVRPTARRREAWAALGRSLLKHARMFHLEGDSNGRHNLPGAPMLDPVSGLLFGIGLLGCVARLREPRSAVLLLWFGAMMAAGVLSVEFEAPQAARTLGATAAIALIASRPLARLWGALALTWVGPAVVTLVLAAAALSSWRTYFGVQASDPAVWAAWSTPEAKIAQVVRDEGRDAEVYVPPEWLGGPTERLILGRSLDARAFERGRDLPLELDPRGRKALVFFKGHETETAELLRRYYPGGSLEPFGPPRPDGSHGDPILWIARLSAEEIAALSGWLLEIEGEPSGPRTVRSTNWRWDEVPRLPPFRARVRGTLRVTRDGPHRLVVASDADVSLRLDGEPVLQGSGRRGADVLLARGNHEVVLEAEVRRPGSETSLSWSNPESAEERPIPAERMFSPSLPTGGLLGSYHSGAGWTGEPAFRQIDPQVAFYFHALPLPRPFSVRWSGSIRASRAGPYSFATSSVDSSSVVVAGRLVVENRLPNASVEGTLVLEEGWHPIEVRYQARSNYSQVYLYWTPPGRERALVPQDALRPFGPDGPEQPEPRDSQGAAPSARGRVTVVGSHGLRTTGALRVARSPDGRLRVLVPGSGRVESLSPRDGSLGAALALGARVKDPSDLAVGPDGRLYVLDAAGAVLVFSAGSASAATIDLRGLAVYNPRGLAVTDTGDLLIADTGGGRVLVCDPAGRLRRQVGRPGKGLGELIDPMDVAVDGTGSMIVVDAGNERIQRFAGDGRVVAAWPRPGSRAGLLSPRADADSSGAVWVAGGQSDEIWRLEPGEDGQVRAFAGVPGLGIVGLGAAGPGRLFLLAPDRVVEVQIPVEGPTAPRR